MKPCPRCNWNVQEDQTECPNCGVAFAQWDAAHPSSPTPVSATGRFTLRHQKYFGFVLVILGLALLDPASGKFWAIGWLLSGVGLALYAKGGGRSPAWGLLALLPFLGPLIGLLAFAWNKKAETGNDQKDKREHLGFVHTLAVLAGGAVGFVAGWFRGKEEVARLAAKIGINHLSTDSAAPIVLGYAGMGGLAGAVATYWLIKLWRRFRDRNTKSGKIDET